MYKEGDLMLMKMPLIRCTIKLRMRKVTGIDSLQAVLVDGVLCHIRDLHSLPYAEESMDEHESVLLDEDVYISLNGCTGNISDNGDEETTSKSDDNDNTVGNDYSPEAPDMHQAAEDYLMLPVWSST